jgi:hypothetical protein
MPGLSIVYRAVIPEAFQQFQTEVLFHDPTDGLCHPVASADGWMQKGGRALFFWVWLRRIGFPGWL